MENKREIQAWAGARSTTLQVIRYAKIISMDIINLQNALAELYQSGELEPTDEINKVKQVNSFLLSLSSSLDSIEKNISIVDLGLQVTNELIDKWAKILVKNKEISDLLFSEDADDMASRWKGTTSDSLVYKEKLEQYQAAQEKYNALKAAKEAKERKHKEAEELRMKRIKERNDMLQRRVYGTKRRGR